jgi:hypothetical protein
MKLLKQPTILTVVGMSSVCIGLVAWQLFGCPTFSIICGRNSWSYFYFFPMQLGVIADMFSDRFFQASPIATLVLFATGAVPSVIALCLFWKRIGSWWKFAVAYFVFSALFSLVTLGIFAMAIG